MNDYETRKSLIENMFEGFGKDVNPNRVAIYLVALSDIPTGILQKAVRKTLLEEKFAPSVATIIEASKGIIGELDDSMRTKEWAEAWGEIDKAMRSTPWGARPKFSTREIEMAVNSYGWDSLQQSLAADMPTVRAQVRRMYEDACKRSKEKNINSYLTGKTENSLLPGNGLKSISSIMAGVIEGKEASN